LTFSDISVTVLLKIHQRFLKLFGATFFKPEKMAKIMKSTRQKTFRPKLTFLSVAALLTFILLIYPALTAAAQFMFGRVTLGDTIKVLNNRAAITIRLVGINAPETFKKKNEPVQSFCKNYTKNHDNLALNKSVEENIAAIINMGKLRNTFYN
jgi:hypothetical protein